MTRYLEHVHSPRWLTGLVFATTLATCIAGLWLLVVTGEVLAGLLLVGSGAVAGLVVRTFRAARVEVDEQALRVRLGPFGFALAGEAIEEVRVTRYRWLAYGGWGLRWGRDGGRSARACSVPFLRTGVAVDTTDGRRYYVNSTAPDRLAAAVSRLADEGRPS